MGTPIDRPGFFQAEIIDYGMCEAKESQSVGLQIKCKLLAMYDFKQEAWVEWEPYDQEADGVLWVIKKDGSLNDVACRSLVQSTGWDGDLEAFGEKRWDPTRCQVQIKEDTYNNKTQLRIAFINPYDRVPGVMGTLDSDKVKGLKASHGSALRALVGTIKTNSTPSPKGKPAAPAKSGPKTPPPAGNSKGVPAGGIPPQSSGGGVPEDDVPFSCY